MNERIRELAEQARRYAFGQIENSQDPTEWSKCHDMFEETFARLIVKDCINIIHQQERIPKGFFYPKGADQHELAIKTHFGIEE